MRHLTRLLLLMGLVAPLPLWAAMETIETNNPDILVKRVFCVDYNVGGILVNKSGRPFRGRLKLAVQKMVPASTCTTSTRCTAPDKRSSSASSKSPRLQFYSHLNANQAA
jgi:hypothetical protein